MAVAIYKKLMIPQIRFMAKPRAIDRKKLEKINPLIEVSIFYNTDLI